MTIFEAVKSMVTPRMAAEHYGMTISRSGMVCCPFHDDRHPSMKLYEDHYHCFGCQANGDVIAHRSCSASHRWKQRRSLPLTLASVKTDHLCWRS